MGFWKNEAERLEEEVRAAKLDLERVRGDLAYAEKDIDGMIWSHIRSSIASTGVDMVKDVLNALASIHADGSLTDEEVAARLGLEYEEGN